jgi:hypothetical protein
MTKIIKPENKLCSLRFEGELTPELKYVLFDFKKLRSGNKFNKLILDIYQKFIMLLLYIVYYLISQSPISKSNESGNSVTCRMRP